MTAALSQPQVPRMVPIKFRGWWTPRDVEAGPIEHDAPRRLRHLGRIELGHGVGRVLASRHLGTSHGSLEWQEVDTRHVRVLGLEATLSDPNGVGDGLLWLEISRCTRLIGDWNLMWRD